MPKASRHSNETRFNLRLDAALKAAFTRAAEAEDREAAQVVRDFMLAYVRQREHHSFDSDARRQSLEAAACARHPASDEHAVMREMEADLQDRSFWRD